jgi:molybdopterin-guanine dinucleotide biosynthesis protein A
VSARFSAVLLAGGKSSRMGRDKAFVEIEGVPLWRRQLLLLRELRPKEIFISGPGRAEWLNEGCIIIQDLKTDIGPLAGLAAGLQRCSTNLLLVLAVDLPHITLDYLRQLLANCSDGIGSVPKSLDRFEPLAAVYPTTSLPVAQGCLESGDHSLQHFVARCVSEELVRPKEIAANERDLFLNLNRPEDLETLTNG